MAVKYFAWDDAKNAKLKADRGIGFGDIIFYIEWGDLLDILEHHETRSLRGQRIFVVQRTTTCTPCRLSRTSTRSS